MRYDSKLDFTFKTWFMTKWEGPYLVVKKFINGSYQLTDLDGRLHKNRVNGLRLKKYVVRIMQVSSCGPVIMKTKQMKDLMDEDISTKMTTMFNF